MFTLPLLVAFLAPVDPASAFVTSGSEHEPAVGRIVKLAADGSVELATSEGNFTVRDFVSLRRISVALPPLPRGPVLITTIGDRIPIVVRNAGGLVGGNDQTLKLQTALAEAEWELPASATCVVWFAKPPAETPFDLARYSWLPPNRNRDILRFRNGDTGTGAIAGFGEDPPIVKLKPESGDERNIPQSEVSALAFNPTLARTRKPKGPYARMVLRDGTRLAITLATADAKTLKGKTLFGQAVEVPVAELVSLDVMQGKATYLADLKPKKADSTGFLGTAWTWTANQTVRGEPLRLLTSNGTSTFDRGIGTHPRTTLTYELGGKYRRFEALIGLDAATGERGQAVVRILVDGKEQPLPELLKLSAGPAIALRIDVGIAKELTLIVDFGPGGNVQADVNWGDARLVE